MTADKMPLILDNGMGEAAMDVDLHDVDDLFGDGVPLALPSRPPTKRLTQRLDELRGRGCCQGIAWSKSGTIASISPDGQSLELRYIRAHPKDASWGLSDPTPIAPWTNLIGGPLVHLSWSPTSNSELAVVDAVGRVFILNFGTNLNKPVPMASRRWDSDPVDDLHTVVGTYWLNTIPANKGMVSVIHAPAVKEDNNYNYEASYVLSNGPYHPNPSKSALICVTTNGVLKMFWNQNNNRVCETTLELESITSSDDLVTHAAMCSERGKSLLVALATSSKQLRIVQVGINWGLPKDVPQNAGPASQPLNPSMKERHVVVSSWFQAGGNDSHLDPAMTQLSHLEVLPQMLDTATKSWSQALVLTVRCFIPTSSSPYNQEVQSIVDRWEVYLDQPQTIHPAFEQLGQRRNSVGSPAPSATRLKKLDPIIINKAITGVHVLHLGKIICLSFSDGTVEYRDRITMNEIYNQVSLERMNSIHEAGFMHTGEPSLQTALSPTNASIVQINEDGKIKWHPLHYTLADSSTITDAQLQAVVAAVTMTTAQALTTHCNIDDVLALARHFNFREQFAYNWVAEMVRMMKIPVDYSEDSHHDSLVRNNYLQLCFSTLNHLGWKGEFQPRQVRSKLSMLALNLRNIVILITIASNTNILKGHAGSPLDESEVVEALAGCCKWSIDLLCWLADSLFSLQDDDNFMALLTKQRFAEMTPYLHTKGEIALQMILSSATRGLLSAVCRRINVLDQLSLRAINYYETQNSKMQGAGVGEVKGEPSSAHPSNANAVPGMSAAASSPALQQAYQRIQRYTSSSLIKVQEFDRLLAQVGADIRESYSKAFIPLAERANQKAAALNANNQNKQGPNNPAEEAVKRAQAHCELTMLLGSSPAQPFLPVCVKFFRQTLVAFRRQTDPAKLFFADYSILEVDDGARALAVRKAKGTRVDLFKRVEIFRGQAVQHDGAISGNQGEEEEIPWRRCARCASVMEDLSLTSNKPGIHFVLSQQRNCCCGGRLALLAKGKLVG